MLRTFSRYERNLIRRRATAIGVFSVTWLLAFSVLEPIQAAKIRSWSGLYQTGSDLDFGDAGSVGYSTVADALRRDGHEVLPGLAFLTADGLAEVDVFFWGVSNRQLFSSESSALRGFVEAGGNVIIESDSSTGDQVSANDAFDAIFGEGMGNARPLGEVESVFGNSGAEVGQYDDVESRWTVGPFGDLRSQKFGASPGAGISANWLNELGGERLGSAGVNGSNFIARFQPFEDGGEVYFLADQLLSNQFTSDRFRFYNESNLTGIRNLLGHLGSVTLASCDLNADSVCDALDIDELTVAVRTSRFADRFDLDDNGTVDDEDRTVWVNQLKRTYFGDANLDGEFGSTDLVITFSSGTYEDDVLGNSGWSDGDWDGDGDFTSSDLVKAFSTGAYEGGPRSGIAAAVPEPQLTLLFSSSALTWVAVRRRER